MTLLDHVVAIGSVLDELGIAWVLGGLLASSLVGEPRSTMDVDVAVALDVGQIPALVAAVLPTSTKQSRTAVSGRWTEQCSGNCAPLRR